MTREERESEVRRWADMVWRLALARCACVEDAEDVFQEVFLRYFKGDRVFESDEHRKAWLIRCTLNRAKSLHGLAHRRRELPLECAASVGVPDEYREVYAAVLALPEKLRCVVHLHYYEGYAVGELASILGCAEGTVKSRLFRARALLRETLGEEYDA